MLIGIFLASFLIFPAANAFSSHFLSQSAELPKTLQDSGLYQSQNQNVVDPKNRLFEAQYPLWSDGARKRRWVYLPSGQLINSQNMNDWIFPVGTKFWKEFSFDLADGSHRKIETRYMEKKSDGWIMATYLWNLEQSEAKLAPEAGVPNYYPLKPGHHYSIPSRNDCLLCHSGARDPVLGFSALQLSAQRDQPALNPESINLNNLSSEGLLSTVPDRQPVIPVPSEQARNAIGYLYGNCMSCHRARGTAGFTGFHSDIDVGMTEYQRLALYRSAVGRRSTFRIPGYENASYRILAGHPEQSAVLFRLKNESPQMQMPPIGRSFHDSFAAGLIEDWIQSGLNIK